MRWLWCNGHGDLVDTVVERPLGEAGGEPRPSSPTPVTVR
jgi:hypothetical protein